MRLSSTPRLSRPALWLRGLAPDRNPRLASRVSASGQLADASPAQPGPGSIPPGLAAVIAVALPGMGVLSTGDVARGVLDRRRIASWDAEWRATGPRWSGQR